MTSVSVRAISKSQGVGVREGRGRRYWVFTNPYVSIIVLVGGVNGSGNGRGHAC